MKGRNEEGASIAGLASVSLLISLILLDCNPEPTKVFLQAQQYTLIKRA
jgi:hypothetical protein